MFIVYDAKIWDLSQGVIYLRNDLFICFIYLLAYLFIRNDVRVADILSCDILPHTVTDDGILART